MYNAKAVFKTNIKKNNFAGISKASRGANGLPQSLPPSPDPAEAGYRTLITHWHLSSRVVFRTENSNHPNNLTASRWETMTAWAGSAVGRTGEGDQGRKR